MSNLFISQILLIATHWSKILLLVSWSSWRHLPTARFRPVITTNQTFLNRWSYRNLSRPIRPVRFITCCNYFQDVIQVTCGVCGHWEVGIALKLTVNYEFYQVSTLTEITHVFHKDSSNRAIIKLNLLIPRRISKTSNYLHSFRHRILYSPLNR